MIRDGTWETPIVTVTESVAEALRQAAEEASIDINEVVIRFSLQQGGDGIAHSIGLEGAPEEGDVVFEQHGLTMVVNEELVPVLSGAHFEYADRESGAQLMVTNPNLA
jgi:iron-sulfur cluster assembly protein